EWQHADGAGGQSLPAQRRPGPLQRRPGGQSGRTGAHGWRRGGKHCRGKSHAAIGDGKMSKQRATAVSWPNKPMPNGRKELLLDGRYTREEFVTISQGLVPQSPADKWFIYLEGQWLYFHRSASGSCIFQLQIAPADE